MLGRHSGAALLALLAAAFVQWSVAEVDQDAHCAMQVDIRKSQTADTGDFGEEASAPAEIEGEAGVLDAADEEPEVEESEGEDPGAEEPALEEEEGSGEEESVEEASGEEEEPDAESAVEETAVEETTDDEPALEDEEPGTKRSSGLGAGVAGMTGEEDLPDAPTPEAAKTGARHGKWAETHKVGSASRMASAGATHASSTGKKAGKWAGKAGKWAGKEAGKWASKETGKWAGKEAGKWAGKAKHAAADESDYVSEMIERFLNKKAPPKNEAVSEIKPLVFMHQHRAGGTTMRKLLYNMSVNLKLEPHIMCSGGVSCHEFKNKEDNKAAVYGGQFCWRELMGTLPERGVSCLTNFREPMARIQSCYTNRLVHTKKIAPACMGKLDATKLKSLLQNYGCVNEPFRRLGHCGLKPGDMKEKKARMMSWNTTLEHLSECVPVLLEKQETFQAAVKYFPQFKQVFWNMKKLKLNENEYEEACHIPETHMAVIKELAAEELLLYDAAHKRAVALNKHLGGQ